MFGTNKTAGIEPLMDTIKALSTVKELSSRGRKEEAKEAFEAIGASSEQNIIKAASGHKFGTATDFIREWADMLSPSDKFESLYDYYASKNNGVVQITPEDLIFNTNIRNEFSDPSFGMQQVDDNTNQQVVSTAGFAIPFTSKSYSRPFRTMLAGNISSDEREAYQAVKRGEVYKFINGAPAGKLADGSTQLIQYSESEAHGLLTTPAAKAGTVSNWYETPANIYLELTSIIAELDAQDDKVITRDNGDGSDICVLLPASLKGIMSARLIGDNAIKQPSILADLKDTFPSLDVQFSGLMPENRFSAWNNTPENILYPSALGAVPMPWALANPNEGGKWTMLSINGVAFKAKRAGVIPLVAGTISTTKAK